MTTVMQIIFGSAALMLCALVHVGIVASAMPLLKQLGHRVEHKGALMRMSLLMSLAVMQILLAHTVQVWTWAFAFMASSAFNDLPSSFYFAMATYTTLGYGDLVLGPGLRIFGTFASITGLLTFGISTAFLIGLLTAIFPSFNDKS